MNYKLAVSILIASFIQLLVLGQSDTYTVNKASFSSDKYDEFSPVYYKNGIVFCSNRNPGLLNYSTVQNKGLFKIYYIDTTGDIASQNNKLLLKVLKNKSGSDTVSAIKWQDARIFSKSLTTKFNDGPVTFNSRRDTIYYSRNLEVTNVLHDISSPRNKLGIFYAELSAGQWSKVRELRYNNEWYNVTTPCLSPDGKLLYFASDKPGGFGGSDLYYCEWKNDYWEAPVNLGPVINTAGNEAYPFINKAGGLFFSSDGHPGFGGKDIFYSQFSDTAWLVPVHLDAPINSQYDDFALIADSAMSEGYFSSKRDNTIDIYHYKTNIHQLFYCENQRTNQYCFKFTNEGKIPINENYFQYVWTFGDGGKANGRDVEHCFPGPGKYSVRLDIVEEKSGRNFFSMLSYDLDLKDVEQPIINSSNTALVGELINFDGLKSYFPGCKILTYTWYFGDGNRTTGDRVIHSFSEKGEYTVKLGLILLQEKTGIIYEKCASKQIYIFNDTLERKTFESITIKPPPLTNIFNYDHAIIGNRFSAEKDLNQDVVFQIEILTSKARLTLDNEVFNNVPKKYSIREIRMRAENIFSYIIAEEMNLMDTYSAYNEIVDLGYKNTRIRTFVLEDPAERELNTLKKVFGVSVDVFFNQNDFTLSSAGTQMLDLIIGFMAKYPKIKLEIATHTDNAGSPNTDMLLSQKRAESMVNYLITNGVNSLRLTPKGYGGSKPLMPNFLEGDKKINRRVEFTIIR